MSMLTRKLARDLWQLRVQLLAVSMVAAVGIANLVMTRTTLESLQTSRANFYRQYHFADVFADLERAPEAVARDLAALPGVAQVDTRIMTLGRAELAGFSEPIRIQAVSLPTSADTALNRVHLRQGRLPEPGEHRAMVLSDAFVEAHRLRLGAELTLTIHGRRERAVMVGVATSPEFVSQMDPASIFPDSKRFAVVWLPRDWLAGAVDMDGAFNSVAMALRPGARAAAVIAEVDERLRRYGCRGAIARVDQRSHRYLSEEFRQLGTMARVFPAVFLSVAAFILYVVLSRLIAGQREQIGTLRAFGLRKGELAAHYAGVALVTGVLSAAMGIALGLELGGRMADLYQQFYRLPWIDYHISGGVVVGSMFVSLLTSLLGVAVPTWSVSRMLPAEAMRPPVPHSRWIKAGVRTGGGKLGHASRLILRHLQLRPWRALLTWIGLAAGTAIIMMGRFQGDAIGRMLDTQFQLAERHDVSVDLIFPHASAARYEVARIPGVLRVEPVRALPAEIRFRAASYRSAVRVLSTASRLRRALDTQGAPVAPPLRGVILTDYLARMIGAKLGDPITIEPLDGRTPTATLALAGVTSEPFGVQAYVNGDTFDRVFDQTQLDAGWLLSVDAQRLPQVLRALERRPAIAGIDQRVLGIRNFNEGMAKTILTFTLIATSFGIMITVGVVYSAARVALSEQERDLASLRILGFTESEVGYLLIGELVLLSIAAVPLGFLMGHGLAYLLTTGFDSDLFRIPHYLSARTHAVAGLVSLVSALVCGLAMRRRVGRLDLVRVLKARE